jgi:hypothetical protein
MYVSVPRHPQNPNSPLTRLRRQLGEISRDELATRTKIHVSSLKALETGQYQLTRQLALKISLGVPVNPFDLLRGANPLRDFAGRPLTADSKMLEELKAPYLSEKPGFETDQFVAKTIFEAAEKKLVAMQFRFLFREALAETAKLLGLEPTVAEELSKQEGEFDPTQVPGSLRPTQGAAAKRWEMYERQIQTIENQLWMERRDQEPAFQITPETGAEEKQRLNWESAKFEAEIHAEAMERVRREVEEASTSGAELAVVTTAAPRPVRKRPSRKRKATEK